MYNRRKQQRVEQSFVVIKIVCYIATIQFFFLQLLILYTPVRIIKNKCSRILTKINGRCGQTRVSSEQNNSKHENNEGENMNSMWTWFIILFRPLSIDWR